MAETTNDQSKGIKFVFRRVKGQEYSLPYSYVEDRFVENSASNREAAENAKASGFTYETMQNRYGRDSAKLQAELKRKQPAMFL